MPMNQNINRSLSTIGKIARWVETDEAVRVNWPFDRQGAQDVRETGSEEW